MPATIASGHACATSTACRTGIPRSRKAASRAASPDKIGCIRDFRLRNGDRIREKLLGLSDFDLFCTYSILESPMGVENYVATLRLTPITDGERTFVEWTAEFDCAAEREAELVTNIGNGVFQGGFDALKRQFGG
jgi:Polyketide cyclase / dehydrase and lipid transport.